MNDGIRFLKTLSLRKLFNFFLIHLSYTISRVLRRPVHWGMPFSISIEPTTSCNLHCPECPSGLRKFSRPQGKVDIQSFHNLIDQLSGKLMYLMLYFQGEPLLVPQFADMVKYARSKGIYTATSTNGHQLDEDNSRRLLESGLNRIIISMDGTDQETYEKYRVGGDLEKVISGIRTLVSLKKECRVNQPYIILQFLVFKFNEHQIPKMQKLAKELGVDRLELKTAQVYNYENDNYYIPENPKFSRYIKDDKGLWKLKKPFSNQCFRMWSGSVITWDGRVVPCCFDKDAQHQLGNLKENSFKEIWRGKAYREFRNQILHDRSQIDICRNCTE